MQTHTFLIDLSDAEPTTFVRWPGGPSRSGGHAWPVLPLCASRGPSASWREGDAVLPLPRRPRTCLLRPQPDTRERSCTSGVVHGVSRNMEKCLRRHQLAVLTCPHPACARGAQVLGVEPMGGWWRTWYHTWSRGWWCCGRDRHRRRWCCHGCDGRARGVAAG